MQGESFFVHKNAINENKREYINYEKNTQKYSKILLRNDMLKLKCSKIYGGVYIYKLKNKQVYVSTKQKTWRGEKENI